MLPSDLNKLVEFLDNHVYYDKEHLGKLLYLMEDDSTRSHLLLSIMKLSKITSDVRKLSVEVGSFMSTNAEQYLEEKIIITAYYRDHVHHYVVGNCIRKLREKSKNDTIVFKEQYQSPVVNDKTKIEVKN